MAEKATTDPQIIVVYTIPRPGKPGTANGQPAATDADWQRLWTELHTLTWDKRGHLNTVGARELDVHEGGMITTVRVPAGPLAEMARSAVRLLRADDTILAVNADGRIATVAVDGEFGQELLYVDDPHPGQY